VPRRLLVTIAALALAASAGATGCADTVSPAARVGDLTISHDDLMTEVEAWAGSPTLLSNLQIPGSGSEEDGYETGFVDIVLSNRVAFELHNAEFEARGLEVTQDELDQVRAGIFADPAQSQAALDELGEEYAEQLIGDIARQFKLQTELGDGYGDWAQEAFTETEIEVSPRYGSWDVASGTVIAPEGPQEPAGSAPLFGQ